MSDFKRCKVCGEYGFMNRHKCGIKWRVGTEDEIKEAEQHGFELPTVYAGDKKEAAEKYAERYDRDGDFFIASEGCAVIGVADMGGDQMDFFAVLAETVLEYSAHEKKE